MHVGKSDANHINIIRTWNEKKCQMYTSNQNIQVQFSRLSYLQHYSPILILYLLQLGC